MYKSTIQQIPCKNFFIIKISFLCTPIDKTTQKNFYKTTFSFLCTPIDT